MSGEANSMSNVNVAHSHTPQSLRMDGSIHVCPLSAVPDLSLIHI